MGQLSSKNIEIKLFFDHFMCRRRHCLTRETLSHPADSLSGQADNVWPGRQCLTLDTASLDDHTHPAGRLSDLAHNLSDPANTRQIVRCLGMLTHARSYLNPRGSLSLRARSIDSVRVDSRSSPERFPTRSTRSINSIRSSSRGSPIDRVQSIEPSRIPDRSIGVDRINRGLRDSP